MDATYEIRDLRDQATKLLDQMLEKAAQIKSPEVDNEVRAALQSITYHAHDCIASVTPRHSLKKKAAA